MTFATVPAAQENNERDAWVAGPYRLVALGYLLRQTRIQLWYWPERNRWPDVLDPQFCTYQDGMACMVVAAITRALADVDEQSPPEIASNHLRAIAEIFGGCMTYNGDGELVKRGVRCKIDSNLGIDTPTESRWGVRGNATTEAQP